MKYKLIFMLLALGCNEEFDLVQQSDNPGPPQTFCSGTYERFVEPAGSTIKLRFSEVNCKGCVVRTEVRYQDGYAQKYRQRPANYDFEETIDFVRVGEIFYTGIFPCADTLTEGKEYTVMLRNKSKAVMFTARVGEAVSFIMP